MIIVNAGNSRIRCNPEIGQSKRGFCESIIVNVIAAQGLARVSYCWKLSVSLRDAYQTSLDGLLLRVWPVLVTFWVMGKISLGLQQSYDLQNAAYEAVMAFKESHTDPDTRKLTLSAADAKAFAALVQAWKTGQERVSFHRRVPSPGSLRPETKAKRARHAAPVPLALPSDQSPDSAIQ